MPRRGGTEAERRRRAEELRRAMHEAEEEARSATPPARPRTPREITDEAAREAEAAARGHPKGRRRP